MASKNQVLLVGRVSDPAKVVHLTKSNTRSLRVTVATTETWKDKTGQVNIKEDYHKVVAYDDGFADLEPQLAVGTPVTVVGSLKTRKWSDNGQEKYVTEVIVKKTTGLISAGGGGVQAATQQLRAPQQQPQQQVHQQQQQQPRAPQRGHSNTPNPGGSSYNSGYTHAPQPVNHNVSTDADGNYLDDEIPF